MTRQPHLDPSPFLLEGGRVGVLLIHGFTGSPPEMRLIGEYLHQRGFTVAAPLLPGHGTVIVEKWVDGKAPFQVIWETMDTGSLQVDNRIPQGPMEYVPAPDGTMLLQAA